MKKLLFVLICLFTANAFAGAFDLQQNKTFAKEQDKLAAELNNIQKNTCNLYGLIEQELLNYYGKENLKDFYDPEHKTGWFRVYDFLTWLKKNQKKLIIKLEKEANIYNNYKYKEYLKNPLQKYCSLETENLKGFLGFFLGKEYLLDKYVEEDAVTYDYIPIEETNSVGTGDTLTEEQKISFLDTVTKKLVSVSLKRRSIRFDSRVSHSFSDYINTGLHETMHMIGLYTLGNDELLPETFTIYSQMAYALPTKTEEGFYSGVRDLYTSVNSDNMSYMEYPQALFAYIQFKGLDEMNLNEIIRFSRKINHSNNNFFKPLLVERKTNEVIDMSEIIDDYSYEIFPADENLVFAKKDSEFSLYQKSLSKDVIKGDFSYYTEEDKPVYLHKIVIQPIDVKKHIENFAILPEYKQVFGDLANEYIEIALEALYNEHDFDKYQDITRNPLKYILEENEDVPPVPEGYI